MIRKLLAGTVLVLIASAASAQTVDEVIARNLAARGGLEKIKTVQTIRSTGKMIAGPGMEIPVVIEQKRPNMMRLDATVQGRTITQAYDGKSGWQINPMTGRTDAQPLPPEALRQADQADLDGSPLVDYKAKGSTVELLGREKANGVDAYKIKVTLKSGDTMSVYVDAERFLEVKVESRMKVGDREIEGESTLGDYRRVEGLMVAFSMESGQKGIPQRQRMQLSKIEVNVPIDDARFRMPGGRGGREGGQY